MKNICPICGYDGLKYPAYQGGLGSLDICSSCGYQFGVDDDDLEITHEEWREKWIKNGMKWSVDERYKPSGWDPKRQFLNIGIRLS